MSTRLETARLPRAGISSAPRVMIVDDDSSRATSIAAILEAQNVASAVTAEAIPTIAELHGGGVGVLVLSERSFLKAHVGLKYPQTGVFVVVILDNETDPRAVSGLMERVDDWVFQRTAESELPTRVARGFKRRAEPVPMPRVDRSTLSVDGGFLGLVVHDIRNPLNVLQLSSRLISQSLPNMSAELAEDLTFVDDNLRQIERMLVQLSDYMRLYEGELPPPPMEFSPTRFLDEILDDRGEKLGLKATPVAVDVDSTCPAEVSLDQNVCRLAVYYALQNATAAAGGLSLHLKMQGGGDRWVVSIRIDRPPPATVNSVLLDPHTFERLCGSERERRGLDLAIAARVTEIFGGSSRLEVVDGESSTIVLDFPTRVTLAQ